ncbi:MAG: phosphatase PAP2 family protein [Bdellovibrionales bacterium]|nr:phosphatase PAP2 family protein [Bdellovibrionales bacterium]
MENLDRYLFHWINGGLSHPWLDQFLPAITDLHKEPIVAYAVLPLILLIWVFKKRTQALQTLLGLILVIACTDNINHRILKPLFQRERPPVVEHQIQLRTDRFGGFSFPSNHATNNFAGATFLSLTYPLASPIFFLIAFLVGLSRVYVGVHYPFDILAGGLWGAAFAYLFFKVWHPLMTHVHWPLLFSFWKRK